MTVVVVVAAAVTVVVVVAAAVTVVVVESISKDAKREFVFVKPQNQK